MTSKNDGGPAFPAEYDKHHDFQGKPYGTAGMSLRDWFAGQALAGLLSSPFARKDVTWGDFTADAYDVADAMLAQRNKP